MTKSKENRGMLPAVGRTLLWLTVGLLVALGLWVVYANIQIARQETLAPSDVASGQILEVDGYRLHVLTRNGNAGGSPLLLVHGFTPMGSASWGDVIDELERDRPVVLVDMLGFGASEHVVEPVDAYTVAGQAELLLRTMDALEIESVDVVGTSYGGAVAARMALFAPERVSRLVLVDAQIYEPGGGFFQALGRVPLGVGRALAWTAQGGGPLSRRFYTQGCRDGGYCPTDADLETFERYVSVRGTSDALVALSETEPDTGLASDVRDITVPTLVLWGEDDDLVPLAQGWRMARDIKGSELVVLEGVGHAPYLEAPAAFVRAVEAFLSGE